MSGPFLLVLRIAMTLSLYFFMGWAFLLLWRNFKLESELLTTRKTPPITLTFSYVNNIAKTKHFKIPEITLGRNPHCDVHLENETVSAHHARLSYHHGQWWLEDLASRNGTTLNGDGIKTPTIVIDNDKISCGKILVTVRLTLGELSPNTQKI